MPFHLLVVALCWDDGCVAGRSPLTVVHSLWQILRGFISPLQFYCQYTRTTLVARLNCPLACTKIGSALVYRKALL